ncbi:hypothetical protein [Streptomyces sp. NPDC093093]|uniref:hypothetical protein n=1 Tax=Streptomyces sp. NPDC093093 TaxID=3366025 RepID=UPI003823E27C
MVSDSISSFPERPISPVSGLKADAVPSGIKVTWNPVFGARGYTVRHRLAGAVDWSEVVVPSNRFDTTWTQDGWAWEYQVRTYNYTDCASQWTMTSATPLRCREDQTFGDVVKTYRTGALPSFFQSSSTTTAVTA